MPKAITLLAVHTNEKRFQRPRKKRAVTLYIWLSSFLTGVIYILLWMHIFKENYEMFFWLCNCCPYLTFITFLKMIYIFIATFYAVFSWRLFSHDAWLSRFTESDEQIVCHCFTYTAPVLHSTIAVQNERRIKNQTQVCRRSTWMIHIKPVLSSLLRNK